MLCKNKMRENLKQFFNYLFEIKKLFSIEKIIRAGLIFLFFSLPLVFFIKNSGFCITKESYAQILVLVLIALWGGMLLEKKEFSYQKDFLFLPVSIFGIFLILSLFWTVGMYNSLRELGIWGVYMAVFFLFVGVVKEEKTVKILLLSILSASFIASVYAIFQFYEIDFSFWAQRGGRIDIFSTFGNPNYLAGYLAACIPVAFILFLLARKKWKKGIYAGFVVIPYIAILITSTRGGWLALFASFLVTLIVLYRWMGKMWLKMNKIWLPVLLTILIFFTIIFSSSNFINPEKTNVFQRATTVTNFGQSSIKQRALMWLSSLEIIKENPLLGRGIGTYMISYPEAQGKVLSRDKNHFFIPSSAFTKHAHNEYLQIPSEIGIIGLILFFWIIVTFYGRVFYLRKRLRKKDKPYLVITVAITVAILTHSVCSFPFRIIQNGLLFWLCLGLVVVMTKNNGFLRNEKIDKEIATKTKIKRSNFSRLFLKRFAQIAIVLGAIFLGSFVVRIFVADMHLARGRILGVLGKGEESRKELEEARKMDPDSGQICRFLGDLYNKLGEYERAIYTFQQARLNWVYPHLYSDLGYAYYQLWQLDKAKEVLEKNIYIYPNVSDTYLNLRKVYLRWAQKYWHSGEYSLLEDTLDKASFYFEQARAFKSDWMIPKELAELYYQVGMQLSRGRGKGKGNPETLSTKWQKIELPRDFFSPEDKAILNILPVTGKSGDPLYIKVFYYQPDGLNKRVVILLEVRDKDENLVQKLKTDRICRFSDNTAILASLTKKDVEVGEYYAKASIERENAKLISKEVKFRVVEKDLPAGEITEFEVKVSEDKKKLLANLVFENRADEFLQILGRVQVKDSSKKIIAEKEIRLKTVVPGNEEKIELALERSFPPGLYQAIAMIIYQGNKVTNASRYFVVSGP